MTRSILLSKSEGGPRGAEDQKVSMIEGIDAFWFSARTTGPPDKCPGGASPEYLRYRGTCEFASPFPLPSLFLPADILSRTYFAIY